MPATRWTTRGPDRGTDWGIVLAGLLAMAISGGVLWEAGINYDGLTGSAAAKFHPATYLTVVLVFVAALRHGDPVGYLAAAISARPASALMILGGGILLGDILATGGSGLAGAIDTFVLPGLLGLLLGALASGRRADTLASLETMVHVVMVINALIGLVESVFYVRIFPFRLDGAIYDYDHRSTGLQGHPLGSAAVTAVYVICLMSGGGALSPALRVAQILLQSAGLVVFGGRTAIALTILLGLAVAAVALHRTMRQGRLRLLALVGVLIALVIAPAGLVALAANGTFDAIEARFTSDPESNGARVAMFELFAPFDWEELLIGPDLRQVEYARRVAGLEIGVENPLLKLSLYNGMLVAAALLVAVILFFREIVRYSRPGLLMPIIGMVVLLNSFESVGSKSTLFAKFLVMLLALYRPPPGAFRTIRSGTTAPTGIPPLSSRAS